jgi:Ca2+-binding RTX toxin-like protein
VRSSIRQDILLAMHMTRSRTATALVGLALFVPATAYAATIDGGPGNERLRGTNAADIINGNDGNDRIFARRGPDELNGGNGRDRLFGGQGDDKSTGGEGRDRIHGGAGNDTSSGDAGRDFMSGGTGDDAQDGGAGNDVIFANVGQDTSTGGDGNDVLWAMARKDVAAGPGVDQVGDTLDGGNGNDRFRTRDGEVDRITCGPGDHDRAFLDQVDVITDATAENPNGSCERVERRAPRAHGSAEEDANEAPAEERRER